MPIEARRLVRKMRGGAQAHLIQASDGHHYVVKFTNNPQHRRILVNEWIASIFLRYLCISAPEVAMVRVSPEFLRDNPEAYIQLGQHRQALEPGWHFGSRFPGDPNQIAVYDFLSDALLDRVENRADFYGVLAFDQWMTNADSRQAVFFRASLREAASPAPAGTGFVAQMVDHGFVFDGPHWRFADSPLRGLYHRTRVYRQVRGLADFQPWLDRIVHFPLEVVDDAMKQIPPVWLSGDEEALEKLLESLIRRRKLVPELIEDCRRSRSNPFPEWH